jgi:beta-lactam-binding protein with PASTA domain
MWNKKTMILPLVALMLGFATGCSKVPDLRGMTQQQAQDLLTKKKLVLGTVTTATLPGKTAGTVVDQDPEPGAKIPDNKTVALVLQAGGTASAGGGATGGTTDGTTGTNNPITVPVPDLTGKDPIEAEALLVASGLSLAKPPDVVTNRDKPAGKIFFQDPPATTPVVPGASVRVNVASDGGIVNVPPVVGHSLAEAEQLISAAQLTSNPQPEIHPGPDAVGYVFEQSPGANVPTTKGQPVLLKVKAENVTVPRVIGDAQEAAQLKLYNSGLTPAIQLVFGDPSNMGMVISQSSPEGTPLLRGTTVIITVGGLRRINPHILYNRSMVLQRLGH